MKLNPSSSSYTILLLCGLLLFHLFVVEGFSAPVGVKTATSTSTTKDDELFKLQGKLLKQVRKVCQNYQMLEDGDHIMVCVSGGKDSATMLYLLLLLQQRLPVDFRLTAVHVDQKRRGTMERP